MLLLPVSMKTVTHIWSIEKFAINFLESFELNMTNAAQHTENSNNVDIISTLSIIFDKNMIFAIIENFKAYAANAILPGHEASTWASGNQTEKGKDGVLIIINIELKSIINHEFWVFKNPKFKIT